MATRSAKPVTVSLGSLTERAQEMVASGRYASMSEVMRAGVRALDREEQALTAWIERRLEDEVRNPSPTYPAEEVFARVLSNLDARSGQNGA